jgi:hypothetical protein
VLVGGTVVVDRWGAAVRAVRSTKKVVPLGPVGTVCDGADSADSVGVTTAVGARDLDLRYIVEPLHGARWM